MGYSKTGNAFPKEKKKWGEVVRFGLPYERGGDARPKF